MMQFKCVAVTHVLTHTSIVGFRPKAAVLRDHLRRLRRLPRHELECKAAPDGDNYNRIAPDACSGLVWEDDSQIVELVFR